MNAVRKEYFDDLLRVLLEVGYKQMCSDECEELASNSEGKMPLRRERLYLREISRLNKKVNELRAHCQKLEQENSQHLSSIYALSRRGQ
jgi:predicted RNase H-like nuclease (RuvC/YqgF family)